MARLNGLESTGLGHSAQFRRYTTAIAATAPGTLLSDGQEPHRRPVSAREPRPALTWRMSR